MAKSKKARENPGAGGGTHLPSQHSKVPDQPRLQSKFKVAQGTGEGRGGGCFLLWGKEVNRDGESGMLGRQRGRNKASRSKGGARGSEMEVLRADTHRAKY